MIDVTLYSSLLLMQNPSSLKALPIILQRHVIFRNYGFDIREPICQNSERQVCKAESNGL